MTLEKITRELVRELTRLRFSYPVACVYNPLVYARRPYAEYLRLYGRGPRDVLFVGMNPGPFGMAQTGIPFGEVTFARDWLRVAGPVNPPARQHPKRPILGFDCRRSEVSGRRLWGWARDRFLTPKRFFRRFFIANYCPLCFVDAGGRNITPDKLPPRQREPLLAACDKALRRTVDYFQPSTVVGIGAFAEARAKVALDGAAVRIGRILHPSPASPVANRDWAQQATAQLRTLGIHI